MMAAGFEHVVSRAIEDDLGEFDMDFVKVESGSITLRATGAVAPRLASLPYLSLVMAQLGQAENASLDRAVATLARQVGGPVPGVLRRARTFRLRISEEGALVRVDPTARRRLEEAIGDWSGTRPDPRGGGAEVWVIRRRDERATALLVRLDTGPAGKPAKGELKPDLASALVRVVPPGSDDVVLDPFAGSGAIIRARAQLPHRVVVATDLDKADASGLARLRRAGELGPNAKVGRVDARDLNGLTRLLDGNPVDAVITDPPWGMFEAAAGGSLDDLYVDAYGTMRALMAPDGHAVVLTGAPNTAIDAARAQGFKVVESMPVLVNGKKASVVVAVPQPN